MDPITRRRLLMGAMMLSAGLAARHRAYGAETVAEDRAVQAFDAIAWEAIGELVIEQGGEERLRIEAEPEVLGKIRSEVRDGRLTLSIAPGRLQTQQPVRILVGVKSLRELHTRGAGAVHIGALAGEALELDLAATGSVQVDQLSLRRLTLRMGGSGDVSVARGTVEAQQVVIAGAGQYTAPKLVSRRASVRIEGSGAAQVAARDELVARIDGSGEIGYVGNPSLQQQVNGAGSIERIGP